MLIVTLCEINIKDTGVCNSPGFLIFSLPSVPLSIFVGHGHIVTRFGISYIVNYSNYVSMYVNLFANMHLFGKCYALQIFLNDSTVWLNLSCLVKKNWVELLTWIPDINNY